MTNPKPGVFAGPDLELERFLEAFERASSRDGDVDLVDYLPPTSHPRYTTILQELIRVDLELAWDRGESRLLEWYQSRFPALFASPEHVLEIALEELRLRRAAGEVPTLAEYHKRFGIHLSDVGDTTVRPPPNTTSPTDACLPPSAHPSVTDWALDRIPQVGDLIPPGLFLQDELGRGAFGRVFLARQKDLAARPVAVKVSSRLLGECQTLARLQHTNIVPVYSVHQVGRFHALVMPFFGRTTLADLIQTVQHSLDSPPSGRDLVQWIAERCAERHADSPGQSCSTRSTLARLSFVDAVLWIGAELADGLAHAHERGILHRDIKPANILLGDDGRPMLLDFNLAADNRKPSDAALCGTLRYMAPEQFAGFAIGRGIHSVQTDVYSLGLVLYEFLAGQLPFTETGPAAINAVAPMQAERSRPPRRVSDYRPEASPAVESILARCLAPDPRDRYKSALELREDLLRQLSSLPLKHAPEPSTLERLSKWTRRHPALSSSTTLGAVAVVLLLGAGWAVYTRQQRLDGERALRARDGLHSARDRLQAAGIVRTAPSSELLDTCATVTTVMAPYQPQIPRWYAKGFVALLSAPEQHQLRQDAAEVLFRGAESAHRLALRATGEERERLAAQASVWNRQAVEAYPGPVPRPFRNQALHLRGVDDAGPEGPDTPFDLLSEGQFEEAMQGLRSEARTGEPRYGVWMGLAIAEWKLGRRESALESLTAASALSPRSPWPYFHRGTIRMELGRYKDAKEDFARYLELAPNDVEGLINQAICRFQLGDARGAVADLDVVERHGHTCPQLHSLRGRARRQLGDKVGADRDYELLWKAEPKTAPGWTIRGEEKLAKKMPDASGALLDFDKALHLNADYLPALRGKVSVLSEHLGRPQEAVTILDRMLKNGGSLGDRAGRAVLLARLGRHDEARREAAECARHVEEGLALYQLACVFLIEPRIDRSMGFRLLRAALRKDPSLSRHMPGDPDLRAIHQDPVFLALLNASAELLRKD